MNQVVQGLPQSNLWSSLDYRHIRNVAACLAKAKDKAYNSIDYNNNRQIMLR